MYRAWLPNIPTRYIFFFRVSLSHFLMLVYLHLHCEGGKCNTVCSRPPLSYFKSLTIRRSENCMQFRNIVRRILKFRNCERVGRVLSNFPSFFPRFECEKNRTSSALVFPGTSLEWTCMRNIFFFHCSLTFIFSHKWRKGELSCKLGNTSFIRKKNPTRFSWFLH